ncbi:hypothetical protein [Caproicibacter sp. BJN0012]|uniref:hypothetical protein n=1 Tax=Caproicibacter sp. BJN0012 TaxID=3110227 RepID=UPI002E0EEC54
MKTGTWTAAFTIYVEGTMVDFTELSEDSQLHILRLLSQGFTSGEVIEHDGEAREVS